MDEPQSSVPLVRAETPETSRFPRSLPLAEPIPNVHECSYLNNRIANLPLNLPLRVLTLDELDQALASGVRRSGVFLYHTACNDCCACEPCRVDVRRFVWRDSFQRVLRLGNQRLTIHIARPTLDDKRLDLFNLHRTQRSLGQSEAHYRSEDYASFLIDSCLSQTLEWTYWIGQVLAGVSIVDCGSNSVSAVYTYFDPAFSKLSIGTYSILKQIEFARDTGRHYAYLGMYVSENHHLNYKARFTPQERWIGGKWREFP